MIAITHPKYIIAENERMFFVIKEINSMYGIIISKGQTIKLDFDHWEDIEIYKEHKKSLVELKVRFKKENIYY